ncbi:hypothetical protein [Kineosporia mesophila]|uniref:hypothetical protein n=1 Tax=Kineosporia mesophila TaxID=566012 RepID=UPI001E4C9CEF|nr:hypothetical protein [Kineosporia mesophila]MCD5352091.1 hypothetical protein [Kineosporia mesophila]
MAGPAFIGRRTPASPITPADVDATIDAGETRLTERLLGAAVRSLVAGDPDVSVW